MGTVMAVMEYGAISVLQSVAVSSGRIGEARI